MSSSSRNSNNRNVRGPSTAADVFSSFSQDFATISNSLPVPGRVDLKSILKEASSLAQKGILDFVDADRLRKEEEETQHLFSAAATAHRPKWSRHPTPDPTQDLH